MGVFVQRILGVTSSVSVQFLYTSYKSQAETSVCMHDIHMMGLGVRVSTAV